MARGNPGGIKESHGNRNDCRDNYQDSYHDCDYFLHRGSNKLTCELEIDLELAYSWAKGVAERSEGRHFELMVKSMF